MSATLPPPYRPNPILGALYQRFFEKIQVDKEWVTEVRQLASQGTVVYILRNLNFVDFFALDHLTKQFELPRIRFANDLGLWVLNPMGKGWLNAIMPRPRTPADELTDALSLGGSAVLFLKRPPSVLDVAAGASGGRGLKGDELVQALIALQRLRPEQPILLVPQLFLWTRLPDTRGTRMLDMVLGPREWASPVRTIGQFLYNYRHVELKLGEPVNLAEFLRTYEGASDTALISRLTYTMLRRLERERRSVTGPAIRSPERVRQEILRSPRFRSEVQKLTRNGKTEPELMEQALSMLKAMQATPESTTRGVLAVALERLFRRIYAGIDIDREGIARIRKEAKEKSLILLPSHKSHMDYLVLSYAFNDENLPLPLIAAGDNLTFFPMGPIFRRAGAFFIRRSFAGDALYPIVVDAYIRRLIREGYPVEMFLEGGRSRTGKLLAPKFGLLKMIVSAALAVPQRPVCFVPVSIGYERVVDSYDLELGGGEKPKEDAAGLLGSANILRSRYGRMNLQFGQILTLEHIRADLGLPQGSLSPAKQRAVVTRLGNRVMDEINRVTAVTPGALTALALLSYHRRGQPHEKLLVRCERLLATLRGLGARTAPVLVTTAGELRSDAIREAAQMFADAELLEVAYPAEAGSTKRNKPRAGRGAIYTVPGDKRLKLDGSKNIIIHFFVERALVALALLLPAGAGTGLPGTGLPGMERTRRERDPLGHTENEARERVQELSRLFKYEFRFRADASFDTIFEETVSSMVQDGDLSRSDQHLAPGVGRAGWTGHQWLMTYAGLLRNFVESYRVAARGLAALEKGPLDAKDLLKQTLSTGRLMYLSGEVERAEAISKPLLQNAFAAFADLGYVSQNAGLMQLPDAATPASPEHSPESASENAPDSEQTPSAAKAPQTSTLNTPRCLEESIAKYLDREVPA